MPICILRGTSLQMNRETDSIERIREISLGLPEAAEKPFGGHSAPAFRVRDKLFVIISEDGNELTLKAHPGVQEALIAADPNCYYIPMYVGHKGWVGVHIGAIKEWVEIAELIQESYRLIAPKRLTAQLGGS